MTDASVKEKKLLDKIIRDEAEVSSDFRKANAFTGTMTALWEMWAEFHHEWKRITVASLITPFLYMVALGWGLGAMINTGDRPYIDFLVPGLVAMAGMNNGFTSVGMSFSTQRLYERSFDQVLISPTPLPSYIFGKMLGGALRGMYTGVLILLLSLIFGTSINVNGWFFLLMLLNGMVFSALGVLAALLAVTHADISRFSTFVIAPMTFLCNTMFPVDRMPVVVKGIINVLPLTHASGGLRGIAYGGGASWVNFVVLAAYAAAFMILTSIVLVKRRNL